MSWVLVIFIVGACLAVLVIVAAMSRHKKSATSEIQLVGSRARVDAELAPEGTVLIHGELWRARSDDGTNIASDTMVHVVGLRSHLLLVERQDLRMAAIGKDGSSHTNLEVRKGVLPFLRLCRPNSAVRLCLTGKHPKLSSRLCLCRSDGGIASLKSGSLR
jgi:hypothetical protein